MQAKLRPVQEYNVPSIENRSDKPLVLTPSLVLEMIRKRQEFQVIKFRTNCTDCVPNL